MKKAKEKKPTAWSNKATPKCAVAIGELLKIKRKQALMAEQAKMLQKIIIAEGGGAAHGVRAALRHQKASSKYRLVVTKARDYVVFLDPVNDSEPVATP